MKICILFFMTMLSVFAHSDEIQLSESELFKLADVAVTGHIESITEGRTFFDSRQVYPVPIRTSIIKLKVESVLKGTVADCVYIEHTTGGMASDILNAAKHDGEFLRYLVTQDDKYGADHFDVVYSEKGVMNEVDQLYDSLVSEGLVITDEQKLRQEIIRRRPQLEAEARRRSGNVDPVNPERVMIIPNDPAGL